MGMFSSKFPDEIQSYGLYAGIFICVFGAFSFVHHVIRNQPPKKRRAMIFLMISFVLLICAVAVAGFGAKEYFGTQVVDAQEQTKAALLLKNEKYPSADKTKLSGNLDKIARVLDKTATISQRIIENTNDLKNKTWNADLEPIAKNYESLRTQLGQVAQEITDIRNDSNDYQEQIYYVLEDHMSEINKERNGLKNVEDSLNVWIAISNKNQDSMILISQFISILEPINDRLEGWISESRRRLNGMKPSLQ